MKADEKDKYVELLIAKTSAVRYVVILLAIVLVIDIFAPQKLKSPFGNAGISTAQNDAAPEKAHGESLPEVPAELIAAEGYETVMKHCGNCHSLKLVSQNRANREGWKSIIEWMQKTQNLWDLGDDEKIILDYLAKNYAPEEKGRRQNLANIEWYELEN